MPFQDLKINTASSAAAAAGLGEVGSGGNALMGTMEFKKDASAVTIEMLLIVRPQKRKTVQRVQTDRQMEISASHHIQGKAISAVVQVEGCSCNACRAKLQVICRMRGEPSALRKEQRVFWFSFCPPNLKTCNENPNLQTPL